ncbi:FecR family protein [Agriterribacter sp.]|uniref:FecR family protein n=1 Tax=Agriterribacter sp. TaxID=2821509 RepID=UPI002B87D2F5|nr:FecR domain-containing protein [Agriterribacter sp.]HTN08201.1 FecR domain-containing protein [Agriterribacter sp.]
MVQTPAGGVLYVKQRFSMKKNETQQSILIAGLIQKYRNNSISEQEMQALDQWRNTSAVNQGLFEKLMDDETLGDALLKMEEANTALHIRRIFSKAGIALPDIDKPVVKHLQSKRMWHWIAAAALITAIAGTVWFFAGTANSAQEKRQIAGVHTIMPGSDKAVLTLADGSQVLLDSTIRGVIKERGNVDIFSKGGRLVYDVSRFSAGATQTIAINTITTPRGGQYQVILPDGTAVWLNAASSISFPAAFTGRERKVTITGEVYFEVARNPALPFRVSVVSAAGKADSMEVTVLGTHFNINAYPDEEAMRTTVVEGLVVVSKARTGMKITPGEQASIAVNKTMFEKSHPDIEEVLAWKNGRFKFSNTGVSSLMRQIARWYDVDIRYEGDVSSIHFSGGISRKDNVEKLLEILESEGRVKFIRQGRTITVRPNR